MSNQEKYQGFVLCPLCRSHTWRYGHDRLGRQKYCCKRCKFQFVAGLEEYKRRQFRPRFKCPKCGRMMEVHRIRNGYIRYRCGGYRTKTCRHKINIYVSKTKFYDSPFQTRLGQRLLKEKFCWYKMKFPKETVSLVLYFHVVVGLPAEEVTKIMNELYSVSISHDTITRWAQKMAGSLASAFRKVRFNVSGETIYTDETVLKAGKKRCLRQNSKPHNKWQFWQNVTSKTKLILSFWLSSKKDNLNARHNFACCKKNSKGNPRMFVCDGLWSYGSAFPEVYGHSSVIRWTFKDFSEPINNNLVERKHGWIKSILRRYRGFKSELGLFAFLVSRIILHNFFMPKKEFDGNTPAQQAGVWLPKTGKRPYFACWL